MSDGKLLSVQKFSLKTVQTFMRLDCCTTLSSRMMFVTKAQLSEARGRSRHTIDSSSYTAHGIAYWKPFRQQSKKETLLLTHISLSCLCRRLQAFVGQRSVCCRRRPPRPTTYAAPQRRTVSVHATHRHHHCEQFPHRPESPTSV